MLFSVKRLLASAAIGASFASFAAADDCEQGMWATPLSVGGGGGGRFCATKWKDGFAINGVEAWTNDKVITGIQFSYSDGSDSGIIGKTYGTSQSINWDPSATSVKELRLYGNGKGTALGHIYIATQDGKTLDIGKNTDGQDVYTPNVASGYILGAYGNSGDNIDNLGLLFLKSKVASVELTNPQFDDTPEELNAKMEGLQTAVLNSGDFANNTPNSTRYVFQNSLTRSTSETYTYTNTWTVGISEAIKVEGDLLVIKSESTTTLSFDYSRAESHETKTQNDVNLAWNTWADVGPGSRIYCQATAMMGTYDGKYTSTMVVKLEDGDSWSFKDTGDFSTTNWGQAVSSCQDKPFGSKRAVKFLA